MLHKTKMYEPPESGPKILLFDLETAPLLGNIWSLWEQNLGLEQIVKEWHLLSWSAKWLGSSDDEVMYADQRNASNMEDDKELVEALWNLLDKADITVGQNSVQFDHKKLNARAIIHGLKPHSPVKKIDTMLIAKRQFGFTSNKLQWLTDKLCTKYKKSSHQKYSGFLLWKECLAGNIEAFNEMQEYNTLDVLSLEELYLKLRAWDNSHPNLSLWNESGEVVCSKCGSKHLHKRGFAYAAAGKFQVYRCNECGSQTRDRVNLLDKEKRKNTLSNIV